jgi:ribA/ribD-fused uncharacterized protein
MPDVITAFQGQYEFLSNFHEAPMEIKVLGNRMRFPSSEAAYQALKHRAMDRPESEQIDYVMRCIRAKTPGLSKKVGRSVTMDVKKWDSIKDNAMREVVFAKFLDNADLCGLLLQTGATLLVEGNTWGDTYWGRCEGKGLNRLGSILMEVRGYWWFAGKTDTAPVTEQQAHIMMGW